MELDKKNINIKQKVAPTGPSSELQPLRTFERDLAKAVKSGKHTLASIAIKEQETRVEEDKDERSTKRKSRVIIIAIIALVIIALGSLFVAIVFRKSKEIPVPLEPDQDINTPIHYEVINKIDTTDMEPRNAKSRLESVLSTSSLQPGFVARIFLIETTYRTDPETGERTPIQTLLGADKMAKRIDLGAPERLIRFMSDDYFIGSYSSFNVHGFLLFETSSFNTTLAEMISWEETMTRDLYKMLSGNIKNWRNESWTDKVIENVDVRVMKNENDEEHMFYALLPDQEKLLIAPDERTFLEALRRLRAPKATRQ